MKLITGQLKPSKGTVKVLGEPIWRNPHLYFQIGFCPEQDAFYERMTGLEWVTALVRLNGLDEKDADEAARRALTSVDLMDAADKKIGAYSKGMRQRVKLAQAIVHDPGAADSRRAAVGHGSARAPPHDPADSRLGARRQEHHRLEPHPARDRVDDGEHPADQQRPDPRRRGRARRSATSSTSIRTRCTSGRKIRAGWRASSSSARTCGA